MSGHDGNAFLKKKKRKKIKNNNYYLATTTDELGQLTSFKIFFHSFYMRSTIKYYKAEF